MGIVQNILNNLRTDLLTINGTGSYTNTISKAFKDLRFAGDLATSDFDACYIGTNEETVTTNGDGGKTCDLSVSGLIYFDIGVDTLNAGTLETKAETYREDLYLLDRVWTNTLQSLDADSQRCVIACDIVSITPYINIGFPSRGELEFKLKIIYYRS